MSSCQLQTARFVDQKPLDAVAIRPKRHLPQDVPRTYCGQNRTLLQAKLSSIINGRRKSGLDPKIGIDRDVSF